ncbi:related to small s protein [Fusarium fujikuroi]|nr:related to small s protein [Fusarium fujikuroi]SCN87400.1 related to small s protein [Fusarium fujikuroi]SCO16488.1 related to small s protein [Fusarium fujikuroi]SCO31076.1 related to small s protein [Fusarium fujikuroi]SCV41572.1 related to small s protein [Fusarium fujikuroi]
MSGAEAALLGVGILCNAMQIMTFAKDSIHVYRNIRDGRVPDPNLDSYLKNAKTCFNEMNQTAAQIGPLGQTQQQIVDIGKTVHDCVDELQQHALALWRGKELEDAEHNLGRHEQLLHSLLLDQVCSHVQAAEITSLQAFQHLDGAIRNMISQLVDGSMKVSDLVTDFSAHISDRVADEHKTTRSIIGGHMTSAETTICHTISQSIDQLRQELLEREKDRAFEKHSESCQPDTDSELSGETQDSSSETADERGFDNFPDWLESDSNVFWISGKPASGKSFLMKSLSFNPLTVKHLKVWRSDVRILTHFFWKPGQLLQRNVEGMVLSLLCQVLEGKIGLCRRLCTARPSVKSKRSHSDWSLDELAEALVWSLEASPESFCIFLDGLDEAKELENLPWPNWTNAQVIHKLLKVNDVKLCASSREEQAFCSFFKDAPQLKIQEFNNSDITLFVRERQDICGLECRDRDELVRETVKSAEGVFLWVALVIDRLNLVIRHNYTMEMLQEILKPTPSDLTLLFTDMWGRIRDDAKLLSIQMAASRYFNLLIIAREIDEYLSKNSFYWHPMPMRMTSFFVWTI